MPASPLTNTGAKRLIQRAVIAARKAKTELDAASDLVGALSSSAAEVLRDDHTMTAEDDLFAQSLGFQNGDALRSSMLDLSGGVKGVLTGGDQGDARAFVGAVSRCPVYPE